MQSTRSGRADKLRTYLDPKSAALMLGSANNIVQAVRSIEVVSVDRRAAIHRHHKGSECSLRVMVSQHCEKVTLSMRKLTTSRCHAQDSPMRKHPKAAILSPRTQGRHRTPADWLMGQQAKHLRPRCTIIQLAMQQILRDGFERFSKSSHCMREVKAQGIGSFTTQPRRWTRRHGMGGNSAASLGGTTETSPDASKTGSSALTP